MITATGDDRMDADYCRISADKTGAAAGVGSQHEENAAFAEEIGLDLERTYTDNDLSAFSGVERPEYERLLADIRAGRVGSVTIWHANRLHRSTEEVNAFIRLARQKKVRLFSMTRGGEYNLERAAGRKQLRDDTSEAEYESEHRGERVALARKRQARNGDYGGGVRPYGWGVDTGRVRSVCVNPKAPAMERVYEDRPVLDMIRHNPGEAAEIRKWADDLLAGVKIAHILRSLAERGVPTAGQADGRKLRRGGKAMEPAGWNSKTLRQVLTHPRTSGHVVYQGQIIRRGAYKPILEEDIRQALITLLSDPSRKTSPGNTTKWLGSLIYRCGVCADGTTMSVRRNTQGQPVYQCRARSHCQHKAEPLDAYITDVLVERLSRADLADLIPGAGPEADVAVLRAELVVLEGRKRDAALRFAAGKIDGDMMETISAATDADAARIRATLKEASARSPLADFAAAGDARATWNALPIGRRREILKIMLVVTLLPPGRGRRGFDHTLIRIEPAPAGARAA